MRNGEALCRLEDCLGVKRIDKAYLVLSGAATCRRFFATEVATGHSLPKRSQASAGY
jgi:hypothetical protein